MDSNENLYKKFSVDEKMVHLSDEKNFTPFGTLCDEQVVDNTTWEDMMVEEESMNDIEKSFQEIRKQKRDQRLKEHQQQRLLKKTNPNKKVFGAISRAEH